MVNNNIVNEDLHFENVMMNLKDNIPNKMRLIDWGTLLIINKRDHKTYIDSLMRQYDRKLQNSERYMIKYRKLASALKKIGITNWYFNHNEDDEEDEEDEEENEEEDEGRKS